ncbi:MAG: hypothetical protein ACK4IK_02755 [Bacteroidia bacterium]
MKFIRCIFFAFILIAFKSGFTSIRPINPILNSDSIKNEKKVSHFIYNEILGNSYISGINYGLTTNNSKTIKFGLNMGLGFNIFNLFNKNKEFDSDTPKDVYLINGNVKINNKIGKTIFLNSLILIGKNKNTIEIKNGINYIDGMFYNSRRYDDEGLIFFNYQTNQLLENFPNRNYLKSIYYSTSVGYNRINRFLICGIGFTGLYHLLELKMYEFDNYTRVKNGEVYYPYKRLIASNKMKILPCFNIGIRF